jgi:hypothetical protein
MRTTRPSVARPGQAFLRPSSIMLRSAARLVRQLVAVGAEQLDAVVGEGLCEAEIITPRSARIERVSMATPGVGSGPNRRTSMPTEVKPATSAGSIM